MQNAILSNSEQRAKIGDSGQPERSGEKGIRIISRLARKQMLSPKKLDGESQWAGARSREKTKAEILTMIGFRCSGTK